MGQHRLMAAWDAAFSAHGLVPGQVLLAPLDFGHRQQYLHARQTLERLLALGVVVPVVNENDAVADDEIRFGDNDRLAALVAHLLRAELMVLLTDTAGILTADPRVDRGASLIEEILEIDASLERVATASGSERGSGGMASKLAAAKIAAWSGVRAVIASAEREGVLADALAGAPGFGTVVRPHDRRLPARKLWIAFALPSTGTVVVDAGAREALVDRRPLAAARRGPRRVGAFEAGDAVEIASRGRGRLRQGPGPPSGHDGPGAGPGVAPRTCPPTSTTRSSIATTSSSCPAAPADAPIRRPSSGWSVRQQLVRRVRWCISLRLSMTRLDPR